MHAATDALNIAAALIEAARTGELACSAAFYLAPYVSKDFGPGEEPSIIAGLLAGGGFLRATPDGFVLGERDDGELNASTLLEGWTDGLCPPTLAAGAYVAAGLHPLYGLEARDGETEVGEHVRNYFASIAAGVDIRVAVCDFRDAMDGAQMSLPLPAFCNDVSETGFRMFGCEPALPIVRALYESAERKAA